MFLSRILGRRGDRTTRPLPLRRVSLETLECRQFLATFTVTNVNDSGPGSLRQAIIASNALSGSSTNTIKFQIGSGRVQTIAPLSALPTLTHPVTINGFTQPGAGPGPRIVLDGTKAGADSAGLTLKTSKSTIEGLAIDDFSRYGINVTGSSDTIADNDLGLTPAGAVAANTHNAVNLVSVYSSRITGNVISGYLGNGVEIYGSFDNAVTGNLIGTNAAGTAAVPNVGSGVKLEGGSGGNVIGGTATGAANVLSGNGDCGVQIVDGATGNTVAGNLIGTDITGTVALGNDSHGVYLGGGAAGNTIGGTSAAARNVLSANAGCGVLIDSGSESNTVAGNLVGVDAVGDAPLGNAEAGVMLNHGSDSNVIGGTTPGAGNVISANRWQGVSIINGSDGNTVAGNLIGTDASQTTALGNSLAGVEIEYGADGNTVGGTTSGSGNVISGNLENGLVIGFGSNGATVQGNTIGTNAAGTLALGNGENGVEIEYRSSGDVIGGTVPSAGNTIADNLDDGVAFINAGPGNLVEGNVISTNGFGEPAASLGDGVYMIGSPGSTVSSNTIETNRDWAVFLHDTGSTTLSGNTCQGNGLGNVHGS